MALQCSVIGNNGRASPVRPSRRGSQPIARRTWPDTCSTRIRRAEPGCRVAPEHALPPRRLHVSGRAPPGVPVAGRRGRSRDRERGLPSRAPAAPRSGRVRLPRLARGDHFDDRSNGSPRGRRAASSTNAGESASKKWLAPLGPRREVGPRRGSHRRRGPLMHSGELIPSDVTRTEER